MRKEVLETRLTEHDRKRLFEALGVYIGDRESDGEGWISGLRLPPAIHRDTNPSLSVNLRTGAVNDFGGDYTGDLYSLVMDVQGCTFPEALMWVARQVGHSEVADPVRQPKQRRPVLQRDLAKWNRRLLESNDQAAVKARTYLTDQRGLMDETLKHYRVGLRWYCNRQYEGWWVVFPLQTGPGDVEQLKLVAFDEEAGTWKRTADGKKIESTWGGAAVLYPLAEARQADGPLLIGEGEIDALTARQHGYNALTGTGGAMTFKPEWAGQIARLPRAAEGVYLAYDADAAGLAGQHRAAQVLHEASLPVYLVCLPEGRDLNDVLQKPNGSDVLRQAIQVAVRYEPEETTDRHADYPTPVPLWGFEKPPPLLWMVAGFLPRGFVTLLAADGGTGKSYLAIYLAITLCLGRSFLGLATMRGRVLYVDYELDEDEQKRRVWRVLAGLGMTPADPNLAGRFYYYRPRGPLSSNAGHDEVVKIIREHKISLVILDSLTIGLGADATSQQDVTQIMQRFREWGTVFAIDHISGQAARGNQSRARPFGSIFKRNIARSTFTLARAEAGGHLLTSDKSNFGPQQDLLCYAIDFLDDGERVAFRRLDHADEEMTGAMRHMTTHEVTLLAIKSVHREAGTGVSVGEVVAWREEYNEAGSVKAGTVRNHFTVLRQRGQIELLGDGTAVPAKAAYTAPDVVHDGSEEAVRDPSAQRENGPSRFTVSTGTMNRESEGDDTLGDRTIGRRCEGIRREKGL